MDRSPEARTLRQVNGRTRLPVDLSEPLGLIESLTSRLELADAEIRETYIPQSEKPDLLNPPWVAPLQNQVKISGFDLNVSVQGPPGVSPEDPGYLPPTPLTSALERGHQYVSNNTPDAGYEVYGPSGDTSGVVFTNATFPVTINLNVPKSVVTSY
jgi:hypothetical protein